MIHKGIRNYTNEELSSISMGQNGFIAIYGGAAGVTVPASDHNLHWFTGFKFLDAVASVKLKSVTGGNTLRNPSKGHVNTEDIVSQKITNSTGTTLYFDYDDSNTEKVVFANGDFIYGAFSEITLGAGEFVLAYRGPEK